MKTWEEMSELEKFASQYSDFHKEAYGFRPRNDVSGWTVETFKAEFEHLSRICKANEEERDLAEKANAVRFEGLVLKLIKTGAKDRAVAIRWLAEAEGVGEDMEFLCYVMGLRYGYFK